MVVYIIDSNNLLHQATVNQIVADFRSAIEEKDVPRLKKSLTDVDARIVQIMSTIKDLPLAQREQLDTIHLEIVARLESIHEDDMYFTPP